MFKGSVCFPGILSFDCLLLKLKNIKTNRLFFFKLKMCNGGFLSSRAVSLYKLFLSVSKCKRVRFAAFFCMFVCLF